MAFFETFSEAFIYNDFIKVVASRLAVHVSHSSPKPVVAFPTERVPSSPSSAAGDHGAAAAVASIRETLDSLDERNAEWDLWIGIEGTEGAAILETSHLFMDGRARDACWRRMG